MCAVGLCINSRYLFRHLENQGLGTSSWTGGGAPLPPGVLAPKSPGIFKVSSLPKASWRFWDAELAPARCILRGSNRGLWERLARADCSPRALVHPPPGPSSPGSWLRQTGAPAILRAARSCTPRCPVPQGRRTLRGCGFSPARP